jgi:hypothetical protein
MSQSARARTPKKSNEVLVLNYMLFYDYRMEHTYEVEISGYNSSGILTVASEIGATHMRRIATGSLNGARGILFAIPCNGGEIRVLDTNADPVWEEEDAAAFAETLVEYGIDA